MTGIGQETAGIGQHAQETRKITLRSQRFQMTADAFLMIVKPPCSTVLDLHGNRSVLEASDQGIDQSIVIRIEAVKDHARQRVHFSQIAHIVGKRGNEISAGDGVKAGVDAQVPQSFCIVVTTAAEMDLHGPASLCVFFTQGDEKSTAIDGFFLVT